MYVFFNPQLITDIHTYLMPGKRVLSDMNHIKKCQFNGQTAIITSKF